MPITSYQQSVLAKMLNGDLLPSQAQAMLAEHRQRQMAEQVAAMNRAEQAQAMADLHAAAADRPLAISSAVPVIGGPSRRAVREKLVSALVADRYETDITRRQQRRLVCRIAGSREQLVGLRRRADEASSGVSRAACVAEEMAVGDELASSLGVRLTRAERRRIKHQALDQARAGEPGESSGGARQARTTARSLVGDRRGLRAQMLGDQIQPVVVRRRRADGKFAGGADRVLVPVGRR